MTHAEVTNARLSIQRSLWGEVTANLMQVSFALEINRLTVNFYYDGPITDYENDIVGDAHTEVVADYPPGHEIIFWPKEDPSPLRLNDLPDEHIVFRRKEQG
jgi:hypothetical protein